MRRVLPTMGVCLAAMIAPVPGEVTFEVVARTGDPVPGIPGATVAALQEATINHRGEIAFAARLSGGGLPIHPTNAVLVSGTGGLIPVLVSGQSLPGGAEAGAIANAPVIVNSAGQVLVGSATTVGTMLAVADGAGAVMVAVDGPLPQDPTGAEFALAFSGASDFALTDSGEAVFRAILAGGSVNTSNNDSLWRASGASLVQIARESGTSPAGPEAGYGFSEAALHFQPVMTTRGGTLAFASVLSGPAVTLGDDEALFVSGYDGPRGRVREGDAAIAPGLPGNAAHRPNQTANRAINAAGDIVFTSSLTGTGIGSANDSSVWLARADGTMTMLLREGQTLPDLPGDVQMSGIPPTQIPRHVAVNSDAEVVLAVNLKGAVTAANDSALYTQAGGVPRIVFREGDAAPGLGGALFDSAASARFSINRHGEVALFSLLIGPGVNSSNNESLWLWSPSEGLELIAREGDALPLAGGFAPLLGASVAPNRSLGDDSANGIWFNNRGEWVFKTQLNGQDAVVKATIRRTGTAALDFAGATSGITRAAAGIYQADFSSDPLAGGTSSGGNVEAGYGFAGQVTIPVGLVAQGLPATLAESSEVTPGLALGFDDGTFDSLDPATATWWVEAGPADFIAGSGALVAGPVFKQEAVSLGFEAAGFTGSESLAVSDSVADNFGTYGGDGLEDAWQVEWFGLPPSWAASPDANPDHDPYDNHFESLTGTDPTNGGDFLRVTLVEAGGGTATLRLSKMIPGTRYGVRRSADLGATDDWPEIMALQTVVEIEDEPFTDPDAPEDRAFYRIEPTPLPP